MKFVTAISTVALLAFAVPAFAQNVYDQQNVQQRTAPGGANNSVSPGEQRGLSPDAGYGLREGRASSNYDNGNGPIVDDRAAPGGRNNGLSPAIQHSN